MKSTIFLIAGTLLLSGCAALGGQSSCDGPKSLSVKLHYGDSELRVTPAIRKVKRRGNLTVKLMPNKRRSDPVDYNTVTVTVVGKSGAAWIDSKSTTYDSSTTLEWCVPANQPYGDYYYEVTVDDVGKLDPRVHVED